MLNKIRTSAVAASSTQSSGFNTDDLRELQSALGKDKGALAGRSYFDLLKKLRSMLLSRDAEAESLLQSVVTDSNWGWKNLYAFLTETRVDEAGTDTALSLLSCAAPVYLRILLSLEPNLLVRNLLINLCHVQEPMTRSVFQQLVDTKQWAVLKLVFQQLKEHHRVTDARLLLNPNLLSFDDLLALAVAKGADADGLPFHEIVGEACLQKLSREQIQQLIGVLLNKQTNSDGIALYVWHCQENPSELIGVSASFVEQQQARIGDAWARIRNAWAWKGKEWWYFSFEFVKAFSPNGKKLPEIVKQFIKNLDAESFSGLLSILSDNWDSNRKDRRQCLYIVREMFKLEPVRATAWLDAVILPPFSELHWIGLVLNVSPGQIRMVLDKFSGEEGYISQMCNFIDRNSCSKHADTYLKPLVNALTIDELTFVARQCPHNIMHLVEPGRFTFAEAKTGLYRAWEMYFYRQGHRYPFRPLPFNNALLDNASVAHRNMVHDLLYYRHGRDLNPLETYYNSFFFRGQFTKTEKLGVAEKILTHIFGSAEEKQAAGPFSAADMAILDQPYSNMRKWYRMHQSLVDQVIRQANMTPKMTSAVSVGPGGA